MTAESCCVDVEVAERQSGDMAVAGGQYPCFTTRGWQRPVATLALPCWPTARATDGGHDLGHDEQSR
jgi:hypothetical protein